MRKGAVDGVRVVALCLVSDSLDSIKFKLLQGMVLVSEVSRFRWRRMFQGFDRYKRVLVLIVVVKSQRLLYYIDLILGRKTTK